MVNLQWPNETLMAMRRPNFRGSGALSPNLVHVQPQSHDANLKLLLGGELATDRKGMLIQPSCRWTLQKSHWQNQGYNLLSKWDEPPSTHCRHLPKIVFPFSQLWIKSKYLLEASLATINQISPDKSFINPIPLLVESQFSHHHRAYLTHTLQYTDIVMENVPFTDDFPIENGGFCIYQITEMTPSNKYCKSLAVVRTRPNRCLRSSTGVFWEKMMGFDDKELGPVLPMDLFIHPLRIPSWDGIWLKKSSMGDWSHSLAFGSCNSGQIFYIWIEKEIITNQKRGCSMWFQQQDGRYGHGSIFIDARLRPGPC